MMSWIISIGLLIAAIVAKDALDPNYYMIAAGLFAMSGGLVYIGSRIGK